MSVGADPERGNASVPPELGAELVSRYPHVSFATVPGARHSIHRDDSGRVVAEAVAALGR